MPFQHVSLLLSRLNGKVVLRLVGAIWLACALFGLAGALLLLLARPSAVTDMTVGLVLRIVLFAALTAMGLAMVYRGNTHPKGTPKFAKDPPYPLLPLLPALVFAAVLVFPNLTSWPWTAPDETHHLIVARNIATYNVYASGHPDEGFVHFDSYDSVGPAVLMPMAAAFKSLGVGLGVARSVMGAFYLLFCVALFSLLRRPYGPAAAAAGVVMATCAFSSIYLGRTLYGEVPAMAYFVFGLVAWRRGMLAGRARWHLIAGVLFGLAVLSKTIMLLAAIPFAAAWWHDRCSWRRIPYAAMILPGLPAGSLLVAWWAYAAQHSSTGPGVMELYQHYLLFGLSPVYSNLSTLAEQPLAHLIYALAVFAAAHQLFGRRYDPALVVFVLLGAFFLYWWLCYTPGQLHRYRWPFYAMAGASLGAVLIHLSALELLRIKKPAQRMVLTLVVLIAVAPSVLWLMQQTEAVYENTELRIDKRVARYIDDVPQDETIATTIYPLRGTLNFMTNRAIAGGADIGQLLAAHQIVIIHEDETMPQFLPSNIARTPMPPYIILSRKGGSSDE